MCVHSGAFSVATEGTALYIYFPFSGENSKQKRIFLNSSHMYPVTCICPKPLLFCLDKLFSPKVTHAFVQ